MEDFVELSTANCMLAFVREESRYSYAYFGRKVANPSDALALRPGGWNFYTGLHYPSQASYPAFGDDTCDDLKGGNGKPRQGMDAYGALAVIHADGVASTALVADAASVETEPGGASHLVFRMRDAVYRFFATQHFRAWPDCDVFETWVELENGEKGPVSISRMDSFAMEINGAGRDATLFHLSGHWAAEAQCDATKIGRGATVSIGSRSGVRGAWESNPAFMVAYGESSETSGRVFGGALAWSGAWGAGAMRTHADALAIHAGVENCSGPYVLDPGKAITLPKFVFTYSDAGRGQVSRNLHAWARRHCMPRGRELRPILLNSWEGAYFKFTEKTLTDMMDGVRDFGGEMFVIDDGWFGRGEFARADDTCGLGDWTWNYDKLPRGPKYLAAEAAKRGLRLGLWFEPEMANVRSEIVRDHPDWVLREPTRALRQGRGGTQVVLDMCNPAVRDAVFRQIDAILTEVPGITYVKWDANANVMNAGSAYLPADRQANVWFDYATGVYELAARLAKAHPSVMFQACSSGGGHVEYGSLGTYADECWGSDDTDAHMRVFIQWGETQFYPANAIGCHVTASPNHQTGRPMPIKFRFDVAMSGRLGFELHPGNVAPDEVPFIKAAVKTYGRIRPVVQQGDLYRLASPYAGDYAALMYVSEDKSRAVLFAYGLARGIYKNYIPALRLQGLDPAKRYRVAEINVADCRHAEEIAQPVGGDALASAGLPVRLGAGYDSAVFEFSAEG